MSNVIKSFSVNIKTPKVIFHDDQKKQPEMSPDSDAALDCASTEFTGDVSCESEDSVEQVDLESVREKAEEILKETEQMVRELLETASREARRIIQKANEEADAIRSSGHEQVKEVHEAAFIKGTEEGYQYGLTNAADETRAKVMEAEKLVEQARQECKEIIIGAEPEIIQLALAVARKVVGEHTALNSECVVDIVKKAIQKATDRQELTVRVNPENLDITLNAEEEIHKSATGIRKMRVTADPAVSIGGCVVETPNETVDARIERQLNEIEQAILDVGSNDQIG